MDFPKNNDFLSFLKKMISPKIHNFTDFKKKKCFEGRATLYRLVRRGSSGSWSFSPCERGGQWGQALTLLHNAPQDARHQHEYQCDQFTGSAGRPWRCFTKCVRKVDSKSVEKNRAKSVKYSMERGKKESANLFGFRESGISPL